MFCPTFLFLVCGCGLFLFSFVCVCVCVCVVCYIICFVHHYMWFVKRIVLMVGGALYKSVIIGSDITVLIDWAKNTKMSYYC